MLNFCVFVFNLQMPKLSNVNFKTPKQLKTTKLSQRQSFEMDSGTDEEFEEKLKRY